MNVKSTRELIQFPFELLSIIFATAELCKNKSKGSCLSFEISKMSHSSEKKASASSTVAPGPAPTSDCVASDTNEKFTFFYHTASPFSQFHPSEFHGVPLFPENSKMEFTFHHCEQWMMFNKAKLFKDEESATKILTETQPQRCKALGRKVKNFDLNVWTKHSTRIIYEGNRLKFTQNPHLLAALEKTSGTTLVEASPTDKIYGIGLSASNPKALCRKTWKGRNILGETLTKLRKELKNSTVDTGSTSMVK